MLFVESKTLRHSVNGSDRIQLLQGLQEKSLTPVIRSARLHCFEQALLSSERMREMEAAVSEQYENENQSAYVPGDLFFLRDHAFFLIFDDDNSQGPLVRAGIIYETSTSLPFSKLDSFAHDVRELLLARNNETDASGGLKNVHWEHCKPSLPEAFTQFVSRQDTDSLFTSLRRETATKRIIGASILEDSDARMFLRRAKVVHAEGYAAKFLSGDTLGSSDSSIASLEDAGLVDREVQVSCRQTGHALMRLPTAQALAVVTVSDATCSECGTAVADEKVEEVIVPTRLAESLLEDSSWLISRLHQILRELGIPESEIAAGPSGGKGYGQMMANVCGESFLLVARDGDLTPSFARWAIDLEIETEAAHLVVVVTGRLHNHAVTMLHNHARRRLVVAGRDFELLLADGSASATRELEQAFERVSHRVIAEQVCDLDNSIGLSMSHLIIRKFRMGQFEDNSNAPRLADGESAEDSSNPKPLALAAHASGQAGEVGVNPELTLEPESFVSDRSDSAH
ncbi:MAG TPA: hypothetical protein VMM84_02055 [Pyrinomonadaceae bacterium]|nr:hypothetical protein [Pyrinomonadaceae bacterium]